jgi:hypothetical protein
MNLRCHFQFWFLVFVLVCVSASRAPAAASEDSNILRLHWLGLNQINTDTNSVQFMKVWELPQSKTLVSQTLDKLSRWPGHGATNETSARLRPLLDDLISSEFYLEIPKANNPPSSILHSPLLLALRLPADRIHVWQANLAALGRPEQITISHRDSWTLVGFGLDKEISQTKFATKRFGPDRGGSTNFWLEADVNPSILTALLSSLSAGGAGRGEADVFSTFNFQLSTFNHVHLTATGENGNVRTHATIDLARPLTAPLPAWEIPTNLIHAPLTSFTAARGFAEWLSALPAWQKLQFIVPPDQAFIWAQVQAGGPFVTYFAAPLPGASIQLAHLAGYLVPKADPWLATNGQSSFQWQTNTSTLLWNDAFLVTPSLKSIRLNQHDYVLGGLIPFRAGNPNPMPHEMLQAVLDTPGLMYYQTELTGDRIEDDLFIGQALRLTFHRPQMPAKAAGTLWLKNLEPLLAGSTTGVTQTGPQQLTFTRTSSIGLTALELHLLADWLESPQFPRGLHTFLAPPDAN